MAAAKKFSTFIVTPKGVAVWPSLGKPNTKFVPEGVFEMKLRMDRNDPEVQALCAKLEDLRARSMDEARAELEEKAKNPTTKASAMAAMRKLTLADSPVQPVFDEDGNETNEVTFKAKAKAQITKADGTIMTKDFIPCFDAKKNAIDPRKVNIGSGSECKVKVRISFYVMPATGMAGLSVRLEAVQVIKLVGFGAGSSGDDFGVEEGDEIVTSSGAPATAGAEEEDGDF
jgi:hypothetical protein